MEDLEVQISNWINFTLLPHNIFEVVIINNIEVVSSQNQELELKKHTLIAWAKYLLSQGTISNDRYQKMIVKINQIKK